MINAYFEIKKNAVGSYYFVFKFDETQNLIVTKSFLKRSELEKCISDIRDAAAVAEICDLKCEVKPPQFEIKEVSDGYIFSLLGFYGNLIFSSEKYSSHAECINTINIIKKLSSDAGIVDNAK